MLNVQRRAPYGEEHGAFRDAVRRIIDRYAKPNLHRWEQDGIVDRSFFRVCGDAGLFGASVPEEYGGMGLDFSFNAVVMEEFCYAGLTPGILLQADIVLPYLIDYGTHAQKLEYAAPMARGETIGAIAMTEPGAGSDLQSMRTSARRDGDSYVINGSKTYITNGQNCDVVIVAAKTAPDRGAKGISLLVVDAKTPGFMRGRNLDKIGQWSADTSELFFEEVRIPASNLLGPENGGFGCLMGETGTGATERRYRGAGCSAACVRCRGRICKGAAGIR